MVDTRFHRFAGPLTLGALLAAIERGDLVAGLSDATIVVSGVSELDTAGAGDIVLAAHSSYTEPLQRTAAGIAVVSAGLREVVPSSAVALVVDRPHHLFADLLDFLYPGSTRAVITGERTDLSFVPVDLGASPEFDQRVYAVARTIPPGRGMTYGEVAAALGEPGAARAVGAALGRNPVPIVVPCHRVMAAGGRAGGFSAPGGASTKLKLLAIEGYMGPGPTLFDL